MYDVVATSKDMHVIELCSDNIFQFLSVGDGQHRLSI